MNPKVFLSYQPIIQHPTKMLLPKLFPNGKEDIDAEDFDAPKLNLIESFMDFDKVSFFHVEDEAIFEKMKNSNNL